MAEGGMPKKGEKMKEFLGIYQIARSRYGLRLFTKKSLYKDCSLKIYQGEHLIISINEENEENMYEQATKALRFWMRHIDGAHASSSTQEGEEDGQKED